MKNCSLNRKETGFGGLPKIKRMGERCICLFLGLKAFLVSDATEIQNVIIFQLLSFGKFLPWQFAFITTFQQEEVNFQIALATFTWLPLFSCYWLHSST